MGLLDRIKNEQKVVRNKDNGTPLERYYKSFFHAIDGITYTFACEHNAIIIFLAMIVATIAGFVFHISDEEWLFVVIIIGLVIASELINTAIEATIDLVTDKMHPLAKIAKDTASSASLVLSITAFIGAVIIFLPKILEIL